MTKDKPLKDLEEECKECDMYNSLGCTNIKGKIICPVRDYLIDYKIEHNEELPYNWRTEEDLK